MARRNKRNKKDTGDTHQAPRTGLEEAWSSSPTRPPRYVLYCVNHDSDRQYVINSFGLYAIRKIFDALVGENEVEPSPLDEHTVTFGDIDIKSDQMRAILDHQYSKAEEEWVLSTPYPEQIDLFLHGPRMSRELQRPRDDGDKPKREKKEPVERKPKMDRSQFITVQSIAEELKIDPRDARAALRKAKVEKPAGGWLGDETWAKGIRDILAKAAKELKGKKK